MCDTTLPCPDDHEEAEREMDAWVKRNEFCFRRTAWSSEYIVEMETVVVSNLTATNLELTDPITGFRKTYTFFC